MRSVLVTMMVVILAGCAVGPDYQRPNLDLPQSAFDSTLLSDQQQQLLLSWWTRFDDPVLNNLIDQALDSNLDIALQAQRVRKARAQLGYQDAQLYPSISGQAQAMREKSSAATGGASAGGGGASGGASAGAGRRHNYYSVAATLNYELDVFGGLRRASEQARAQLLSQAYTQDSIKLSVVGDVVANYMSLRSLQRQIRVTKETIRTREQGLDLDQKRYQYGAIDKLTLQQTKSLLQSARAQLPPLQQQESKLRTSLAILTGKTPRQILNHTEVPEGGFDDIQLPTKLPMVLPSQLVERRPDVRAAEASLIAANANVGVAKAQFFPSFNLTSMIGTQALDVDDLFEPISKTESIGGSIAAPILDFGRINAQYRGAKAQKKAAEVQYRQTVRKAFQGVHDALDEIKYSRSQLEAVQKQVDSYQETLRLANVRYQAGQTDYFDVLDAQRKLFNSQLDLATAIRDRFTATADLYKALGGGWSQDSDALGPDLESVAASYEPDDKADHEQTDGQTESDDPAQQTSDSQSSH